MPDAPMIEQLRGGSDEALTAVRDLVRQVSSSAKPPTLAELEEILSSPASRLLIVRDADGGRILGMLTLAGAKARGPLT